MKGQLLPRIVLQIFICCFAVVNPLVSLRMSREFSGIPVEFHRKPLENWAWLPDRFPVSRISSLASRAGEIAAGNITPEMLKEPEPAPEPVMVEAENESTFRAPQFGLGD